jgi:hypothetical protein
VNLRDSWRLAEVGPIGTAVSIGRDFHIADNDDNAKQEAPPNFNNLDGAIKIWDRLDRFRYLVIIKKLTDGWYVPQEFDWRITGNPTLAVRKSRANIAQESKSKITLSWPGLLLREDLVRLLRRGPYLYGEPQPHPPLHGRDTDPNVESYSTLLKLVSNDRNTQCFFFDMFQRVVLQAECISERLSLQSSLTDSLVPPPPLGGFASSFPDVDDLAKHLTALSLDDLQTFFLSEKNRSGEKIEFPGVKLPGKAATSWAIVILIVLASYFLVVLREFSLRVTRDDKAWNVPWIGISQDIASRIAFLTSMVFVLSTVGYLTRRGALLNSEFQPRILYAAASVAAVAVVATTLFHWRKALALRRPQSSVRHRSAKRAI